VAVAGLEPELGLPLRVRVGVGVEVEVDAVAGTLPVRGGHHCRH